MFVCFVVPPEVLPIQAIWLLGIFIALGQGGAFIVPDAILADIIDYSELMTSVRSEGLYCILETNCQQLTETIGGVIPQILLALTFFMNNGGCECGCNVKCEKQPYLRWKCPGSIGYACSGAIGAPLMFGDPEQQPPCVNQTVGSIWVIRIFFMAMPSFCLFVVGCFALLIPINHAKHEQIQAAIAEQQQGERVWDPLTGAKIMIPKVPEEPSARRMLSFTVYERGLLLNRGLFTMRAKVLAQCLLWCGFAVVTLAVCFSPFQDDSTRSSAIAAGSLCCAALFVLLPWDGTRLYRAFMLDEQRAMQAARDLEQLRASIRMSIVTSKEDQAAATAAKEARKSAMSLYSAQADPCGDDKSVHSDFQSEPDPQAHEVPQDDASVWSSATGERQTGMAASADDLVSLGPGDDHDMISC
jgi:hypothetical protein